MLENQKKNPYLINYMALFPIDYIRYETITSISVKLC